MIILLRNKLLDRSVTTRIPRLESDNNPYQTLSLEYDSETDTELQYPSQYLLLQYDLQTGDQIVVQNLLDLQRTTSDITKVAIDNLLIYDYQSQEGYCQPHIDLSHKSNTNIIPWAKDFFVAPQQLLYLTITDRIPICCTQVQDQLHIGLLSLLVNISSTSDNCLLFIEAVFSLLEDSSDNVILRQAYQKIFDHFLLVSNQQLSFFQYCLFIQSKHLISELEYIYPHFYDSVSRRHMRQVDTQLLTPIPMYAVDSMQQLQQLNREHFPILLTTASSLLFITDDNSQNAQTQLKRRPTRKTRSLPSTMKPKPIRALILTKSVYSSLKNQLIHCIDNAHSTPPTENAINTIKSKVHHISLKHRLMTSRTEWKRLQNLKYLSTKLRNILLTYKQSLCTTESSQLDSPLLLLPNINNHSLKDVTKRMHEPGD